MYLASGREFSSAFGKNHTEFLKNFKPTNEKFISVHICKHSSSVDVIIIITVS